MKKVKLLGIIGIVMLMLHSCSVSSYYQYYDVASAKNGSTIVEEVVKDNNEDCSVVYNFWEEGGNAGFWFYNNTDENIYIHLDECFFILNGIANDYYKNRMYCSSYNTGIVGSKTRAVRSNVVDFNVLVSSSVSSSSSNALVRVENKVICVPSKTSKYIREYTICDGVFRDCGLLRYPNRKTVMKLSYSLEDSPFVFSNRIAYSVGKSNEIKNFENKFYISKIQNIHPSNVFIDEVNEYCGEKKFETKRVFKNSARNQFYVTYLHEEGSFKH